MSGSSTYFVFYLDCLSGLGHFMHLLTYDNHIKLAVKYHMLASSVCLCLGSLEQYLRLG